MRFHAALLGLSVSSSLVHAHYTFGRLLINDTVIEDYRYTRKATSYLPFYVEETQNNSLRCFHGVTDGAGVETATIIAGDTVGLGVYLASYSDLPYIYHAGPANAYLSRAPDDDLESYLGDGDWFKIGEYGPKDSSTWELGGVDKWKLTFMNFTIPETTPPGKYLLRGEHLFPLYPGYANLQFYVGCVHVDIVGPGGGSPGPMIKLPEDYTALAHNDSIAFPPRWAEYPEEGVVRDLSDFTPPGPSVWTG